MIDRLLAVFPGGIQSCLSSFDASHLVIEDPGGQDPIRVSALEPFDEHLEDESQDSQQMGLTLINRHRFPIQILAIDKCLMKDHHHQGQGRCEGLFTYANHLCWFEIKDRRDRSKARKDAATQLEDTITHALENKLDTTGLVLFAIIALSGKKEGQLPVPEAKTEKLHFLNNYRVVLKEGNLYTVDTQQN